MLTRTKSAQALAVLIAASLSGVAGAQTPLGTTFTYQGQLKSGGSPATGNFDMEFRLFDDPAGGAPLATQTLPGVGVANGLFTVQLDFGALYNGNKRWLDVTVAGTPLSPRQELTAAPNALFASNADQLDGLNSTAFLTGVPNPLTLSGSNASHIIRGENASLSAGSTGVSGISTAAGGQTYGGDFRSSSPVGFGVYGVGGVGVFGESINTSGGGYGGYFQSPSTSGTGVFGKATPLTGLTHGGWFETYSTDGRGLLGIAHASTGSNVGVLGQSNSVAGRGVNGLATAATGTTFGVIGESHSTDGRGVFGIAHASTGGNVGVFGQSNSPAGYGVYSLGNMHATGVISGNASGLTNFPVPFSLTGSGAYVLSAQNTSPDSGAAVQGLATAATGTTMGGRFESASDEGIGVLGLASTTMANGYTSGVQGQAASSIGRGVFGRATSTSGENYGVWGQSDSSSGKGVYGLATNATGVNYGVWGESNSPGGYGVVGINNSPSGFITAVFGRSSSTDGCGVAGRAISPTGTTVGGSFESSSSGTDSTGVYGFASAGSGTTYGVRGDTLSTSGQAVLGQAAAASGVTYGVRGLSVSPDGTGVYGIATASSGLGYGVEGIANSTSGFGVRGIATAASGTTYGVYGRTASASGYGVYSQGNTGATGTKSFRIDHPDDPANKYLLHYAAESPEVINFYRGNVVLDGAGAAVVELPRYFAKINRTPSYQLTAIGAPMPTLHVAEEIDEAALSAGAKAEPGVAAPKCSFRIAGGAPGARVSWRVEAVRSDRWVKQGGAPVEVEKQGLEKGTYQHPELYGQPPEKGMNYDAARRIPEPVRPLPTVVRDARRP